MASFKFTSSNSSIVYEKDGEQNVYNRQGELRIATDDESGQVAYLFDEKTLSANFRSRINIDLTSDIVDVNGVTVFANAGELVAALSLVFFSISDGGSGPTNPNASEVLFTSEIASLANGAEIDTGFIDFSPYAKQQIAIVSDSIGLTFVQTLKASDTGVERTLTIPLPRLDSPLNIPIRLAFQRLQIQNNSGASISNVTVQIKAYMGGDGATVATLDTALVAQSQALLTRSVLAGNPAGQSDFKNVVVNPAGALLTSDYGTEVAQGKFPGTALNKKFGRNNDIDGGSAPEDVWNGGGLYTGFDCVAAEILEFFSSSTADTGSLVSSGTATGGSGTTVVDTGATFVTDGVAIGDLVINDTQLIHGVVSAVTSETELTVFDFTAGGDTDFVFEVGDAYRVASAASTGAAVIRVSSLLDASYDSFAEYIIMNGTTPVSSAGSYLRQSRGVVVLAGTEQDNVGEVTGRQSTTVANVTMVMPARSGQTAICCDTVPRGQNWIIKTLNIQMARVNGNAGSAQVRFQTRKRGEAWQTRRFPEISNSLGYSSKDEGGIVVTQFTDVRWNVEDVSDNNTIVSAEFEYFIIQNGG